jgi:hypothetical protein
MDKKRVVVIFLDGVGLGSPSPEVNPFMHVEMQSVKTLLGTWRPTQLTMGTVADRAALLGLDALLGVSGLPQSATGQTAILTGQNAAALLGEHYGPYPNQILREVLIRDNLFRTVLETGQPVAYANAYPERFLDRVRRGKGRMSANTFAAYKSGLKLRGHKELQNGRAIAALLSNDYWPETQVELPPLSAYQAGQSLAALAQDHTLTFFEYWYSDLLGHKMYRDRALESLADLDDFLSGLLASLDLDHSLMLVISDHGNFEDWTTKKHTANPALTLLAGAAAEWLVPKLADLTDIKPAILSYLSQAGPPYE